MTKKNIFYKHPKEIVYIYGHLTKYGNTCLNYHWVERFGIEAIRTSLLEMGFDCNVRLDSENCPDSIYDYEYDQNRRIRVTYPILPCVIIEWKDHERRAKDIK